MVEVRVEAFDRVYDEMLPYLRAQHEENETNVEGIPLDPAVDTYRSLESQGLLSVITARDADDLVGYLVLLVFGDLHHKDYKIAQQDIMYVVPDKRGSEVAQKLLKFTEAFAKIKGATWLRITMKAQQRFDKLLESNGMSKDEITYAKRID
jgi:GNAT superfamily N-acetyltransferase